MERRIAAMAVARALFLATIIWAIALGRWNIAAFNIAIFGGSAFLPWMARRNSEYALLDALICITFTSTVVVSMIFTWQTLDILGFDKLYHTLGGMCLAWFAAIMFKKYEGWSYAILIVGVAFSVGIIWEFFEWGFSVLPPPFAVPFSINGIMDSVGDVIADTIGGAIVASVFLWRKRKTATQPKPF